MPATMRFHNSPRGASPRAPLQGIETGNKVGDRPVVRQSKIYRTNESGNNMKSIFGQDHLAWDVDKQQGVFDGQGVFDAANDAFSGGGGSSSSAAATSEVEYPLPGSVASCDSCGSVVQRFYHCTDCREETGLFDLCTECCAAIYLKQGARAQQTQPPDHPTHVYSSHRMVHIAL